MNVKRIAAAVLAAFFVTGAQAATVLDQAFDPSSPVSGAPFSEGVNVTYENFSLAGASNLTDLSFWGVHWSSGAIPASSSFVATVYQNVGGAIGGMIQQVTINLTSVIDTGVDHNGLAGANILEYSGMFSSAISLLAGDYWLSIYHTPDDAATSWAWQRVSSASGQYNQNGFLNSGDMALVLNDDQGTPEVPLPAAGWLLLAGLGSMAAVRRRTRV